MQNGRVALVLMGGGAKGAYQLGVWKALWELGIRRFSAISGTSVGALNAVLIAQGEPSYAEQTWTEIIAAGVLMKPSDRWRRVARWALGYFLIFSPAIIALPVVIAIDFSDPLSWLRSKQAALLILALGGYLRYHAWSMRALARQGTIIPFFVANLNRYETLAAVIVQLGILNLVIAAFQGNNAPIGVWFTRGLFVGFLASMMCMVVGLGFVTDTLAERPLFVRDRLDNRIREVARNRNYPNCSGDVFATLGRFSSYQNPLSPNPFEYELHYEFGRNAPIDWRKSPHIVEWTPRYVNLSHESDPAWVLGATSAVPFAFQAIKKDGETYVDGGVVDNVPIAPVLRSSPDYVIVVMLDDEATVDSIPFQQEHIERLTQQFVFSMGTIGEIDQVRQEWIDTIPEHKRTLERELSGGAGTFIPRAHLDGEVKTLAHPLSGTTIVLLKPSRPVASKLPILDLVTGTLKFTPEYLQELSALGYKDTMVFFA